MPDIGAIIQGMIITVLAAVMIAAGVWFWARRRMPIKWAASGIDPVATQIQRLDEAKHQQLVDWVLQRAETLGLELPVEVTGRNPAVITLDPTGRRHARYPDFTSYRAAMEAREWNPRHADWGEPPAVVSAWSGDRLRAWLREHADEMPSGKAA